MKTKLIFAIIAVVGALAIYLWRENELLAGAFVALVWGVYERITKEEVKNDFKKAENISYSTWKNRQND